MSMINRTGGGREGDSSSSIGDRSDSRRSDRRSDVDDFDDVEELDFDDDDSDGDGRDDYRSRRSRRDESRPTRSQSRALRRERLRNHHLQRQIDELKSSIGREPVRPDAVNGTPDLEKIKTELRRDLEESYSQKLNAQTLVTEALAALSDRRTGLREQLNPRRVVRLLDLDSVDIVDGRVDHDSLLDAIDELKEESPELFRRSRPRRDDEELDEEDASRRDRGRPRAPRSEDTGNRSGRTGRTGGSRTSPLEQALRQIGGSGSNRER